MSYYDALIAAWAALSGTTAQKLQTINAMTAAGPSVDVPPSQVVRYLAINGKLAGLLKYAANPPATQAGTAAAELAAVLSMGSNAPVFYTSHAQDYAILQGMLNALAGDAASGITSTDVSNLLALAATTVTWCKANGYPDAQNGGGGITIVDLANAGGLT